jgi:putative sporulation protein YtaF
MHFLYTILIALANNLDNIGVRIAYSIRGIKIPTSKNLWISSITFIISSLAAFAGSTLSGIFTKTVSAVISMVLLAGIGIYIIVQPYVKKDDFEEKKTDKKSGKIIFNIFKKPENADMDNSKDIDFKEATFLGVALSINNVGGGLSAGMIGLNAFFVGFLSAVISFAALWAGNYITKFFTRIGMGNKATVIAGAMLVLLGVKQLF